MAKSKVKVGKKARKKAFYVVLLVLGFFGFILSYSSSGLFAGGWSEITYIECPNIGPNQVFTYSLTNLQPETVNYRQWFVCNDVKDATGIHISEPMYLRWRFTYVDVAGGETHTQSYLIPNMGEGGCALLVSHPEGGTTFDDDFMSCNTGEGGTGTEPSTTVTTTLATTTTRATTTIATTTTRATTTVVTTTQPGVTTTIMTTTTTTLPPIGPQLDLKRTVGMLLSASLFLFSGFMILRD